MTRVLVCGGRRYANQKKFRDEMNRLHKEHNFSLIIQGGAKGADFLAHLWSQKNGIKEQVYNAHWERFGRAAGGIRNKQMLDEGKPELVIAFPGGSGTANMIRQAEHAKVKVIKIEDEDYTNDKVAAINSDTFGMK